MLINELRISFIESSINISKVAPRVKVSWPIMLTT